MKLPPEHLQPPFVPEIYLASITNLECTVTPIKEKETMKVFCSECKWLKIHLPDLIGVNNGPATPENSDCDYQDNIINKTLESWYRQEHRKGYFKKPSQINAYNDCKWFEKKPEPENVPCGKPTKEVP